jgi:YHS domain-containing protein
MKRVPIVSWTALAFALTAGFAPAQTEPPKDPAKPAGKQEPAAKPAASEKVTVVFLGNATCPADGKAVDRSKSIEVDGQRVYVCSDTCLAALKSDPTAAKSALTKAYAKATPIDSKACTCGSPTEAGKATVVAFQGNQISLCSADCVTEFRKNPVTTIVMLKHPGLKDAKNMADATDGKPVDPTIVAVYKTNLVHFSSWENAAAFEKDPAPVVAKLKLSN